MIYNDIKKVVAAVALFIRDNKILLVHRLNTGKNDGMYGLIGGKVEASESVSAALIREIFEEVGVVVTSNDLELAHCMSSLQGEQETVGIYFRITNWQGELVNKEPHKHADITWFSVDPLQENIIPRNK